MPLSGFIGFYLRPIYRFWFYPVVNPCSSVDVFLHSVRDFPDELQDRLRLLRREASHAAGWRNEALAEEGLPCDAVGFQAVQTDLKSCDELVRGLAPRERCGGHDPPGERSAAS